MQDWSPSDLEKSLESGAGVFLKLWKKGCGACKLSSPAVERLEESAEFPLTFAQISTDDHPEILEIAGTEVLPVFFVFHRKEMLGKFEGFKGLERLRGFVRESLESKQN